MSFLKKRSHRLDEANIDPWLNETLFQDGDAYFTHLIAAIDSAKTQINFETYIFEKDSLGKKIITSLSQAALRGVQVRLLLDGAGSYPWNREDLQALDTQNFEIRFFHPLPWQKRNFKIWKYLSLKKMTLGFFKFNHRNHRKICTIDSRTAYLGSMNVSDWHLKSIHGNLAWRDTTLCLEGDSFDHLLNNFENAWKHSENYFIHYWLKNSRLVGRHYRNRLIEQIKNAKERVWVTTPYFFPDRKLIRALTAAAQRGVEVKLLFPMRTDFTPSLYAARSFYQGLLNRGVQIFEYQPSMLHAKVMIIDSEATLGSSNLNYRSLIRDLEIEVQIQFKKSVDELSEQFHHDLGQALQIDRLAWKARPLWKRTLEKIFLIFRGSI